VVIEAAHETDADAIPVAGWGVSAGLGQRTAYENLVLLSGQFYAVVIRL
jgi:hypothetical protein